MIEYLNGVIHNGSVQISESILQQRTYCKLTPEDLRAITIDDEGFELVTQVMVEYDCDSVAKTIEKSANVAP